MLCLNKDLILNKGYVVIMLHKKIISLNVIFILLFSLVLIPTSSVAYNIDGDKVYWENSYGKLEVWPHTSDGLIQQVQYANITWYGASTNLDIAFRFGFSLPHDSKASEWRNVSHNVLVDVYEDVEYDYIIYNVTDYSPISEPSYVDYGDIPSLNYANVTTPDANNSYFLCGYDTYETVDATTLKGYYNVTEVVGTTTEVQYWYDWVDITSKFTHELYNGQHYYIVQDVPFNTNQVRTIKLMYDIPHSGTIPTSADGKWDFIAKLSSDDIQTAFTTGRYVMVDPWWNSSWSEKAPIQINNTGEGALTDYQLFLNVTYDSDMQSDFDDLRFVNETADTELSYWIESKVDLSYANVWFNVTSIPATSWLNDTIYMYYGNAGVETTSEGNTTFTFFDNFDGSVIDAGKWSGDTEHCTVTGGIMTWSPDADDRIYTQDFSPDMRFRTRSKTPYQNDVQVGFIEEPYAPDYRKGGAMYLTGVTNLMTIKDASDVGIATNWDESGIFTIKQVNWGDSYDKVSWYENDVELTGSPYTTGANIPDESMPFKIFRNVEQEYDWVFVTKVVETEPGVILGSEQSQFPNSPTSLSSATGNFYVNYTWQEGTGNGSDTDSYNVSINSTWHNGTTVTYFNQTTDPHGWVNITVWAYNSTYDALSESSVSDETQIPNNPITITDYSDYTGDAGDSIYIDFNYTDLDGDTGTFATDATEGTLNTSTGVYEWSTTPADWGTYHFGFNVSDGYGSVSSCTVNITLYYPGAFTIADPWNNVTNDSSTEFSINNSQWVFLSINSTSHTGDQWFWFVNGLNITTINSTSNITLMWNVDSTNEVSVYAYNNSTGMTSNTITWEITVGENLLLDAILSLLEEEQMIGLSLLLTILILAGIIFFLLGVLVPNSILTLLGAITFFVAMALPIPILDDYSYVGIALTMILFLFGIIGILITFYQWFTLFNKDRGYQKWDQYFEY